MSGSYHRPQKDEARRDAFLHAKHFSTGRPYRSLLTLPSREALCAHELKRLGMIDDHTRQLWVERQHNREPFLRFERDRFAGPVDIKIASLEDIDIDRDLDFVFADMESTLTPRLARWIDSTLGPRLVAGADIVSTFTRHERNNPLYRWLEDNQDDSLMSQQIRKLRISTGTRDPDVIIPLALLHSALQIEVSGTVATFPYGDLKRMKMISFVIPNLHRGDSPWPKIDEVIAEAEIGSRSFSRHHQESDVILLDVVEKGLERFLMSVEQKDGGWVVQMNGAQVTEVARYDTLAEIRDRFQIKLTKL